MEKNLKNIQTFEQHTDKNLNISVVMNSVLSDLETEISEYQKLIDTHNKYGVTEKTKILKAEQEGVIKGLTFAMETLKKHYS
jgi:hypothetical protein